MARPMKEIRLKDTGTAFQVLHKGQYKGRLSYQMVVFVADLCSSFGTDMVLERLSYLKKHLEEEGIGTPKDANDMFREKKGGTSLI